MRRKKDKSNGITALYERLSRDDDNAGESNSTGFILPYRTKKPTGITLSTNWTNWSCPQPQKTISCMRNTGGTR